MIQSAETFLGSIGASVIWKSLSKASDQVDKIVHVKNHLGRVIL